MVNANKFFSNSIVYEYIDQHISVFLYEKLGKKRVLLRNIWQYLS